MVKNNKIEYPDFISDDFEPWVENNFKDLRLLNYYPWGSETKYWVMGSEYNLKNLKNENYGNKRLNDLYKKASNWQLISDIHAEVNRACHYLTVFHNKWFERQRLDAFCYSRLITSGFCTWVKVNKDKARKIAEERLKQANEEGKITRWKGVSSDEDYVKNEFDKIMEHGVWSVHIKPLYNCNSGKINYNRKQLIAIHFMITKGEFENLC